ncbi:MAG: HEAT repeat domain-containing protein, partial [Planctomycetota bacterium]|nr:HEAT repeat domain-containing protein [Planctomycetota bacterium]
MRIAATAVIAFLTLTACSTTESTSPYQQPNALMGSEISQRIDQIPFQHREELVQNLLWLAQTGEQAIPALLDGLGHEHAKVRSSCCWVLGRMRDRRTVPQLQRLTTDTELSVRMEASRSLVLMGDIDQAPNLIQGLDSDRKEVRFMCHEALKSATGHDFGYDHLGQDQIALQTAVLRWRQWWSSYSGDAAFAQAYMKTHGLGAAAMPGGETGSAPAGAAPSAPKPTSTA